jgi:hypothetical protein
MQAFRGQGAAGDTRGGAPGSGWCAVNATAERADHGRQYTKRTNQVQRSFEDPRAQAARVRARGGGLRQNVGRAGSGSRFYESRPARRSLLTSPLPSSQPRRSAVVGCRDRCTRANGAVSEGRTEAPAQDDARASESPTRPRPRRQGETKAQPRARVTPIRRPTRLSIRRPTRLSIRRPTRLSVRRPTRSSVRRPTRLSVRRPTRSSVRRPTRSSVCRPTRSSRVREFRRSRSSRSASGGVGVIAARRVRSRGRCRRDMAPSAARRACAITRAGAFSRSSWTLPSEPSRRRRSAGRLRKRRGHADDQSHS